METKRDHSIGPSRATAASLVAILSCSSASETLAAASTAELPGQKHELLERVAKISERIRLTEPALYRELEGKTILAQWRSR